MGGSPTWNAGTCPCLRSRQGVVRLTLYISVIRQALDQRREESFGFSVIRLSRERLGALHDMPLLIGARRFQARLRCFKRTSRAVEVEGHVCVRVDVRERVEKRVDYGVAHVTTLFAVVPPLDLRTVHPLPVGLRA